MDMNYRLQDKFLKQFFSQSFAKSFYLTGGTALARFYFHHRESADLDLFTNDQSVDFSHVSVSIQKIIRYLGLSTDEQVVTPTFIQYITKDHDGVVLKIDVVKDIPVHIGKLICKKGIFIDSLDNIGSNKVLAIFGRTDGKDYIDLYWSKDDCLFPRSFP